MIDTNDAINQALAKSGVSGYQQTYASLGGGEGNDTYVLDFEHDRRVVLRIARYEDQQSLIREADALTKLDLPNVPKLIFFDSTARINGKLWILESYIAGQHSERLNVAQLYSLGTLLANVHHTTTPNVGVNVWQHFITACQSFGNEAALLDHPEPTLRRLIIAAQLYAVKHQPKFSAVQAVLVHGDATPSNILTQGSDVALIDWEFSSRNDPMAEFSTIYYDDMAYNQGKWRVHIAPDERTALFDGYTNAGGVIDTDRLQLWMIFDKLGAAVFLYWRINQSGRPASDQQLTQYQLDLETVLASLKSAL